MGSARCGTRRVVGRPGADGGAVRPLLRRLRSRLRNQPRSVAALERVRRHHHPDQRLQQREPRHQGGSRDRRVGPLLRAARRPHRHRRRPRHLGHARRHADQLRQSRHDRTPRRRLRGGRHRHRRHHAGGAGERHDRRQDLRAAAGLRDLALAHQQRQDGRSGARRGGRPGISDQSRGADRPGAAVQRSDRPALSGADPRRQCDVAYLLHAADAVRVRAVPRVRPGRSTFTRRARSRRSR